MKVLKMVLATISFLPTLAFAAQSVDEILDHYYSGYDKEEDCRTTSRFDDDYKSYQKYCMKYNIQKTVDTDKGKRLYMLAHGYNFEWSTSGLREEVVGLFVLKPDENGNGWDIETAKPVIRATMNGSEEGKWTFHQFAPNTYGFLTTGSVGGGGASIGQFNIIIPNGKSVVYNNIGSESNNLATAGCENKKFYGKNIKCEDLSATIEIDRSTVINGFYPLDLTLNGKDIKGKIYKNKVYRINYQKEKGYVEPNNYPLKDLFL